MNEIYNEINFSISQEDVANKPSYNVNPFVLAREAGIDAHFENDFKQAINPKRETYNTVEPANDFNEIFERINGSKGDYSVFKNVEAMDIANDVLSELGFEYQE